MPTDESPHAKPPDPWPPDEDPSELVQRLRELEWPQVSEETRRRCWEELRRDAAALTRATPPAQRQ